ncbi:MAG: DsrE family protein [Candidatus Thorarchaeota archaeon]
MESVLICCDKGPYGTNVTAEAIRLVAGFLGLGPTIECHLVLDGDAVYMLKSGQDVKGLGVDSLDEPLELLELVDADVYIVEDALAERGLTREDLIDYPNLHIISMEQLSRMITDHSSVFHM